MSDGGTDLLRTRGRTFRRTTTRTLDESSLYLDFTASNQLDPRITFSRGSQATLFDSAGTLVYAKHNLLQRSQALATLPWFNSGLTSIANDTTDVTDPAGGNNASKLVVAGVTGIVGQDAGTLIANQTYVGSVWLRCASGTVSGSLIVYLGIAPFTNIGTQSITITTTWQRFTVTTSAATAAAYNFQIHNLNGGTVYAYGAQFNLVGMEGGVTSSLATYYPTTTAAYYAPRFDYNPSTLAAQGLLIEEQRTNSLTYSEDFGNAAWTKGGATISTDTTAAPSGTTTADSLIEDASTGQHRIYRTISGTTNTNPYTVSFFAKANTRTRIYVGIAESPTFSRQGNAIFDLSAGTVVSASAGLNGATGGTATITAVGNGWYRCSYTLTLGGTDTSFFTDIDLVSTGTTISYTGNGTSGLFIWGAQFEAGAFATSYIPTTTTALTRNADVASMTGTNFSSWYNATEGTLYYEGMVQVNNDGIVYTGIGDTFDNTAYFVRAAPNQTWAVRSGASAQAAVDVVFTPTANVPFKMVGTLKVNDFAFCVNGGTVATDVSGAVPAGAVRLGIGNSPWAASGGNARQQWIRSIRYYPVRLPNSTLQALTA